MSEQTKTAKTYNALDTKQHYALRRAIEGMRDELSTGKWSQKGLARDLSARLGFTVSAANVAGACSDLDFRPAYGRPAKPKLRDSVDAMRDVVLALQAEVSDLRRDLAELRLEIDPAG